MHEYRPTLLWFDDRIDELDSLVQELRTGGFDVTPCSSGRAAIESATESPYDVVLGDIRLVEADKVQNGIQYLRDIHQIRPSARYAVLSSYLYLQEYIDLLHKQSFPIYVIEKFVGIDDDSAVSTKLVEPLLTLARGGGGTTIGDIQKAAGAAFDENPFDLRLNDFLERTQLERQSLSKKAKEIASATLNRQFEDGYIWVLLCGNSTDVRARSKTVEGILKEDRVWALAKAHDSPPFQFMARLDVGEIGWSTDCAISHGGNPYPTVTLELRGNRLTLHFDTGAQTTLFSYERLTDLKVIEAQKWTINTPINGDEYESSAFDVSCLLHGQDGVQSVPVQLSGIALLNWVSTKWAKRCPSTCRMVVRGGVCVFRDGLVGRTLLNTKTPFKLVLDGTTKQSNIVQ